MGRFTDDGFYEADEHDTDPEDLSDLITEDWYLRDPNSIDDQEG